MEEWTQFLGGTSKYLSWNDIKISLRASDFQGLACDTYGFRLQVDS